MLGRELSLCLTQNAALQMDELIMRLWPDTETPIFKRPRHSSRSSLKAEFRLHQLCRKLCPRLESAASLLCFLSNPAPSNFHTELSSVPVFLLKLNDCYKLLSPRKHKQCLPPSLEVPSDKPMGNSPNISPRNQWVHWHSYRAWLRGFGSEHWGP